MKQKKLIIFLLSVSALVDKGSSSESDRNFYAKGRMMSIARRLVIFSLFLIVIPLDGAMAINVKVRDINIATVNVPDQLQATFQAALPQALKEVLIRMSGNTQIMTLPAIQNILPAIDNYIEEYSYLTQPDANGKTQLKLQVVFDVGALKHILQDANQPFWEPNRPLMMMLISTPESSPTSNTIVNDAQDPLVQVIKDTAVSRGLPIIFPTMDLEDQANLNQPLMVLPSSQQIKMILRRYHVDCALIGIISFKEVGLGSQWQLFLNGVSYKWQSEGVDAAEVVRNAMDHTANMMSNQFAVIDSKAMENYIFMQVSGVKNLDDYVHVISTLKHITPVTRVSVIMTTNELLFLKVKIAGNVKDLINSLKTVSELTVEAAPTQSGNTSSSVANVFYRWQTKQIATEEVH